MRYHLLISVAGLFLTIGYGLGLWVNKPVIHTKTTITQQQYDSLSNVVRHNRLDLNIVIPLANSK